MKSLTTYLLFFAFFFSEDLLGQYRLEIIGAKDKSTKSFNTIPAAKSYLNKYKETQLSQGHLEFSIDSITINDQSILAYVHPGRLYYWENVKLTSGDSAIIEISDRKLDKLKHEKMDPSWLPKFIESKLIDDENSGFPFASFTLHSFEIHDSLVSGVIHYDRGNPIIIDTLILKTEDDISNRIISNIIDIFQDDLYNEERIQNAQNRINETPYLESSASTEIIFSENKAEVYLYVKNKKASTFNGIIGVQPDAATSKTVVTGDIDLQLVNAVKKGENFGIKWMRLQEQTQDLKVNLFYPFLFNTQLGVEGKLDLYRRDTTFSNTNLQAAVLYQFRGTNHIKAFYRSQKSTHLGNASTNPLYANISMTSYGIGGYRENLDYKYNPRKGSTISIEGTAGNRVYPASIPENAAQKNVQLRVAGSISYFHPIYKKFVFMLQGKGATILDETTLYENELYRIGGLSTIRGTDEQSIFASSYGIGTVELRYLLEKNTRVYLFFDQAWYENQTIQGGKDSPLGFGAGISFQVNAGIFSLNYGLGKQFENPIDLRSGKVHFGFSSVF